MNKSVPDSEREKAEKMFLDGRSQADVMRACHVSRSTASRWHALWDQDGSGALRPKIPGFGLALTVDHLQRVDRELQGNTDDENRPWSIAEAAVKIDVIRRTSKHEHLARRCPRATAFRLLHYLGWEFDDLKGRSGSRPRDRAQRQWRKVSPSPFEIALHHQGK